MWITKLITVTLVANNITDCVLFSNFLSRPENKQKTLYQNSDIFINKKYCLYVCMHLKVS